MNIQELELKHWQVSPKYTLGKGIMNVDDAEKHVRLSIQFALEILRHFSLKESTIYSIEVYNKIEELEKYL